MSINKLTEKVIGCAIEVHKMLGPGLLESAYEQCLAAEMVRCVGLCLDGQPMRIGVLVRFANRGQIVMYTIANGAKLLVGDEVFIPSRERRRKDTTHYREREYALP